MLVGEIIMKQICYLVWLAGMATLVVYGWSDVIVDQAAGVMQLMGQMVAFMMT